MAPVTPVMASTREYSCAATSSKSKGAEVLPTDKMASSISGIFMPRIKAKMSASVAPTPAPSVGVKRPSQIPPSTSTIRHKIPRVLSKMAFMSLSSTRSLASRARC